MPEHLSWSEANTNSVSAADTIVIKQNKRGVTMPKPKHKCKTDAEETVASKQAGPPGITDILYP